MASIGLNFVDCFFIRYLFEEGTPGEYIYRLELLEHFPSHPESQAYLKFLEETGVEYISSITRWVYLRKKANEGPFDIYSDFDTKIKHFKRIASLTGISLLSNLFIGISNILIGINQGTYINLSLSIGTVNLIITIILTRTTLSYMKKIKKMKREKQLHE